MHTPTLAQIREAIIAIRESKLPHPDHVPNAGSFFKNPIISKKEFKELQEKFPDVRHFEIDEGIKIPAGWLIEHLGIKGKSFCSIGVHKNNALVLYNKGEATQKELVKVRDTIVSDVQKKFGIALETEPNIIDFV